MEASGKKPIRFIERRIFLLNHCYLLEEKKYQL